VQCSGGENRFNLINYKICEFTTFSKLPKITLFSGHIYAFKNIQDQAKEGHLHIYSEEDKIFPYIPLIGNCNINVDLQFEAIAC
jgi:hypothetical protein